LPHEPSELESSESELRVLLDVMACGLVVLSPEWEVLRMNPAAEAILGWRFAELSGKRFRPLWVGAIREDGAPFPVGNGPASMAFRTGQPLRNSILGIHRRNGQRRWLQLDLVPAFHSDGSPRLIICSFLDITERKLAEQALQESEARYRLLFDCIPHPMWVNDAETHAFLAVNEAAVRHYGYDREEFLAMTARDIRPPEEVEAFIDQFNGRAAERRVASEWRHRKKDGTVIHVVVDSHQLVFVGRAARVAVVTDITEQKRAEEALAHQALYDVLTDLPNRTLLHDRLGQAIRGAERSGDSAALLVMDLDRFKEVNDTFGHYYGDALLRQVGERLQAALRGGDTLARLGGDEFAVVLEVADRVGAVDVADRLLRALDVPFAVEGHNLSVGASIGIALFPDHAGDADTLLRRADVAMYVAKRSGNGHALYAFDQDQHSPGRLALAGELRHAIEHDQLVLHYQPKLELRTGAIIGVEALVRWRHPQHGLVAPDQFIPLAEQTGLIRPLSKWVLAEALRQYEAWRVAGFELPVAVNVSMRDLHDPQLLDTIGDLLAAWNLAPLALNLEITESSLMTEPDRTLAVLAGLREIGVGMAIDDYGTGYSSLGYLKQLPVVELKIDRSFVRDMARDRSDLAIVRSTVELAHNLGLRVVAEGVEDAATQQLLAELGCDQAQGYYISRPLPNTELTDWLNHRLWQGERRAA
jgi:diguanylate cyclase (GGDEF)-like protein/PAS domain S-box-containing protein